LVEETATIIPELSAEDKLTAAKNSVAALVADLEIVTTNADGIDATDQIEQILVISGKVVEARKVAAKLQLEANKGAITEVENNLINQIKVLVENTNYEELTGKPLQTLVWYVDTSAENEDEGPIYGVRINPARRTSTRGTSNGSARGKSNWLVSRTNDDGTTETLTVKDAVNQYASDHMRGTQLFEPKKAWSSLFPKMIKEQPELGFGDPVEPTNGN
jgi:hypothetical protein